MRVALRRFRGELRRLAHPTVAVATVGVALASAMAQTSTSGADLRPPSPIDVTGSLRIAAQHHASTFGFVLIATMAACTTATDVRIGTVGTLRMADHDLVRTWRRRTGTAVAVALCSILVSTGLLWSTRSLTSCRTGCPPGSGSTMAATAADLGATILVLVFAASFATALAVHLGSELATIVVAAATYAVPANRIGASYAWVLPTKWIAQVMQFEPYGLGSDYTGGPASTAARGRPAATAALLLLCASAVCARSAILGLRRRSAMGSPST